MYKTKKRVRYTLKRQPRKIVSIDYLAGYLFVWVILAYVAAFGYVQTKGFHIERFNPAYFAILLPIWCVDGIKVFFESFTRRSYKSAGEDLSKVTVVIACKNGEDVIGQTLKALVGRFDPHQIIVASNNSTDSTCQIARGFNVRVLDIAAPLGKVRAINYALDYVDTPYVLLLDDDTIVGDAPIPTGLLDEGYEGVAFRVLVGVSNWLSRIQMYEYRKSTDLGKRYHNSKASVQNISGAIGLFSFRQLKRQIKKHSGEFSGEDLQRTLLIHLTQNAKGVVLTDSTVYTQPPTTLSVLFQQRSFGWFPGLYANFFNYLRIMTRDRMPMPLRLDAFYNTFLVMLLDGVRLLSLPIVVLYPWYFAVMYGLYFVFEAISYVRSSAKDPLWILFVYPFYGLFGFFTRAAAFATFLYRRSTVQFARREFLDDYRSVPMGYKFASIFLTIAFLSTILAMNVATFFVEPIINVGP